MVTEYTRKDLFFEIVRSGLKDRFPDDSQLSRINHFCDYANGKKDLPTVSLPVMQEVIPEYIDGLTATPYWNPAQFAWCQELEKQFSIVRDELMSVIQSEELFRADSSYSETMGSGWTSVRLQRMGIWNEVNVKKFPRIVTLLRSLQIPIAIRGVMFARQLPQSGVSQHSDGRNFILTAHLGLIIPKHGECSITVANEKRQWQEGKILILDTSFLHETKNTSVDEERIVLIIDFWHPELTEVEQRALEFIYDSRNKFEAGKALEIDCSYIRNRGLLDIEVINQQRRNPLLRLFPNLFR